jgi:hypothetical protein
VLIEIHDRRTLTLMWPSQNPHAFTNLLGHNSLQIILVQFEHVSTVANIRTGIQDGDPGRSIVHELIDNGFAFKVCTVTGSFVHNADQNGSVQPWTWLIMMM